MSTSHLPVHLLGHSYAKRKRGFTLIELMVVVAVVGILAAIAYPSYLSQVRKSRRSDAVQALAQVQQAQERWRANNAAYNGADLSSAASGLKVVSGTTVVTSYALPTGYYTIALGTASSTGYTLTATGSGSQASDTGCSTLTVTVVTGTPSYTPSTCWSK